jgi:monoamine oxidase
LTETDGQAQTADFDEGLYFNPGPARIAHHHQATLHYCRELGVAVEPFIHANQAAYYYNEGRGPLDNRPVRIREVQADLRGYTAELLTKAIGQEAIDAALSTADQQKLLQFLDLDGDLGNNASYRGSSRRGYSTLPGAADQPGLVEPPHDLSELLQSELGHYLAHDVEFDYQTPMFQIVGGTDIAERRDVAAHARRHAVGTRCGTPTARSDRCRARPRPPLWHRARRSPFLERAARWRRERVLVGFRRP